MADNPKRAGVEKGIVIPINPSKSPRKGNFGWFVTVCLDHTTSKHEVAWGKKGKRAGQGGLALHRLF